jgi:hypothetical protein
MKKFIVLIIGVITLGSSASYADWTVHEGWDLFVTVNGTQFNGEPFLGEPLGTFNFGGSIGTKTLNEDIDTIMHRTEAATVTETPGNSDTIEIELVALQLKSVNQFNWGAGNGYHYITLDTGQSSTGTMDITFDDAAGGTFDSFFTVYYDIRYGAVDGTIISFGNHLMEANSVPWGRVSPDEDYEIQDVNYLLDGSTTNEDFWPDGEIIHIPPTGTDKHNVSAPEPATMSLLAIGGLALIRRRKRA